MMVMRAVMGTFGSDDGGGSGAFGWGLAGAASERDDDAVSERRRRLGDVRASVFERAA